MKFGYQGAFLVDEPKRSPTTSSCLSVNNGVPNQLTRRSPVSAIRPRRVRNDALYAQEQWTRGRMTLQGALRFDHAWSYFPEQRVGRHALPADADRLSARPTA